MQKFVNIAERGTKQGGKWIYGMMIAVIGFTYKIIINDPMGSPSINVIDDIFDIKVDV